MTKSSTPPGAFLIIPLGDDAFGYGRVLDDIYCAFYDVRTSGEERDLDGIASRSVLFKVAVRRRAGKDEWRVLGHRDLEPALKEPVVMYSQDLADYRKCTISDSVGHRRSATPEECVGLETVAVWDAHHIEDRLRDHFLGRTNAAVEHFKVRLA